MLSKLKNSVHSFTVLIIIFIGFSVMAAERPKVAIKTPIVNPNIAKDDAQYLNLDKLLSELESSMVKVRKFDVLTRKDNALKVILEEQEFAQSDFSQGNAAQSGQLRNINFWIIPTIQQFEFKRLFNPIPNMTGKFKAYDMGTIELDVQVLDTTTGSIKENFYLYDEFETQIEVTNQSQGQADLDNFTLLAKKVASQMADQLIDSVFPMKILKIKENQAWINRGKDGGLDVGMKLDIYGQSELFKDPDTQETIVIDGEYIATATVARIAPKYTIIKIEGSVVEPIEPGFVLRKQTQ